MKALRFFVIFLITLIVGLITLLVMAIYHTNYNMEDSIVFVESMGIESKESGMGFLYSKENNINYIVTNYHVVDSSEKIYVYNLNNKQEEAFLVYFDVYTDIAILKVNDTLNLKPVEMSNKEVKLNDKIYYYNLYDNNIDIGSVIGLENEITITSDYGSSYYNAVSIKAEIDSGNSGSPIFNKENQFIGMVSLKDEKTNEAYFVDYKTVSDIVTKLKNNTLVRPNLGGTFASSINVEALNNAGLTVPNINGVVILDTKNNSSLSFNGLEKGDVITKINDNVIVDTIDLQREIYAHEIGEIITVEYYRGDVQNKANITLEK